MTLASPLVLLALVPLAALLAWLMVGKPTAVTVPFVSLWPQDRRGPASRARRRPPPPAITLLWLAASLAVLALARPTWTRPAAGGTLPAAIVVDRGESMRSPDPASDPVADPGQALLRSLADALLGGGATATTTFTLVAGEDDAHSTRLADLDTPAVHAATPPTSRRRLPLLQQQVRERLDAGDSLVVVLTDRTLDGFDPSRVVTLSPPAPARNAGLERVSVASGQVMVEATGDLPDAATDVIVRGGGLEQRGTVSPASPVAFVPLPSQDADAIEVRLGLDDAVAADDAWVLVRSSAAASLEQSGAVSPMLRRWIASYREARPESVASDGRTIAVLETADPPAGRASLAIVPGREAASGAAPSGPDHPLLAGIDLREVPLAALEEPGDGWTVLSRDREGRPLLAVRDGGGDRGVRIGLDLEAASRSAMAVALLTSAADWLAGPAGAMASIPLAELPADAVPLPPTRPGEPGAYRLASGVRVAAHLATVASPRVDPPGSLDTVVARWRSLESADRSVPLAGPVLLAAAVLATLALVARRS